MKRYASSFGSIELTGERLKHILTFHPEVRSAVKHFGDTLVKPDFTKLSPRDSDVVIFYRAVSPARRLAIVAKVNAPRFILTAYLITNLKLNNESQK